MRRIICCSVVLMLAGCTPLQAWERGYLAKPEMAFDSNPATAAQMRHIYESKEAARGGYAVGGAACGCN